MKSALAQKTTLVTSKMRKRQDVLEAQDQVDNLKDTLRQILRGKDLKNTEIYFYRPKRGATASLPFYTKKKFVS